MERIITNGVQTNGGEELVRGVINLFDDCGREGLKDTPKRYMKFLREFMTPEDIRFTVFDAEGYDEMIIVKDIPFYSLCEHHLAPFFGTATVAYIPNKKIVGLSKIPRLVDHYARRFQNQERITKQVGERMNVVLSPLGVGVVLKARHLCMEMRGVKKCGAETVTSFVCGVFKDDEKAKSEFFSIIK